jgi:hypothetical protein
MELDSQVTKLGSMGDYQKKLGAYGRMARTLAIRVIGVGSIPPESKFLF